MIEFFEMITRNEDMSVKVNSHSYPQTVDKVPVFAGTFTMSTVFLV